MKELNIIEQIGQLRTLIHNTDQQKYYDWILNNGKKFSGRSLTSEEEKKLQRLLTSPLYHPRRCFYNCQMIMMSSREYQYFEGYGQTETIGFNLEHAWLIKDGILYDPTWRNGTEYFGVEIPYETIRKSILDTSQAQSLIVPFVYTHLN